MCGIEATLSAGGREFISGTVSLLIRRQVLLLLDREQGEWWKWLQGRRLSGEGGWG